MRFLKGTLQSTQHTMEKAGTLINMILPKVKDVSVEKAGKVLAKLEGVESSLVDGVRTAEAEAARQEQQG